MEYLIAFNFTAEAADGITAQLNLTDSNSFEFDRGVQVQQYWPTIPVPPLKSATVGAKGISILTQDGGSSGQQGIRVTLQVSANGSTLSGNIPFMGGPQVGVSYQFVGYANQGSLQVGNFSIPFPSS
jgi:hypothetical protein